MCLDSFIHVTFVVLDTELKLMWKVTSMRSTGTQPLRLQFKFYDFSLYVFSEPLQVVTACNNMDTDAQIQENVFPDEFLC